MQGFEFGNRIYELRKAKGISQKELGAMLGVSNKAVSKWETGASMPKAETLIKMAEIFELPTDELLETSIEKSPTLDSLAQKADKLFSSDATSQKDSITERKKAKTYLCCVTALFVSLSIILFFLFNLGNIATSFFDVYIEENTNIFDAIWSALGMAFVICGVYTGFVWAVRLYKKLPSWLLVLCFVLFFFTFLIIEAGGTIMLIPTIIKSIQTLKSNEIKEGYYERK